MPTMPLTRPRNAHCWSSRPNPHKRPLSPSQRHTGPAAPSTTSRRHTLSRARTVSSSAGARAAARSLPSPEDAISSSPSVGVPASVVVIWLPPGGSVPVRAERGGEYGRFSEPPISIRARRPPPALQRPARRRAVQPPIRRPDHQLAYVRQFLDCGERDQPPQVVPLGVGRDRPAVLSGDARECVVLGSELRLGQQPVSTGRDRGEYLDVPRRADEVRARGAAREPCIPAACRWAKSCRAMTRTLRRTGNHHRR
ncbi:hypothetical protein SAMN05428938_6956 [Streptomyces sp. KS_5]|nr:hypothetical protein SAMN05428938_6956 [Streptomyces sp. KS_5]